MKRLSWFRQLWLGVCLVAFLGIALGYLILSLIQSRVQQNALLWNSIFTQAAGRSFFSYGAEGAFGFLSGVVQAPQTVRFLILGTDSITGSGRSEIRTDTIMVVSLVPTQNRATIVSIPRDLYFPERQQKVNALYADFLEACAPTTSGTAQEGKDNQELSCQASQETAKVLSGLIGQPIDRVILIAPEDLAELVDILGGIEINVTKAFTDTRFPRSNVDVRVVHDPNLLYETVQFASGSQRLSGTAVMQYVRSRHSSDPSEGSDVARARRQREVVAALVHQLLDPTLPTRPAVMGSLAAWYRARWQAEISPIYLGWLAGQWYNRVSQMELVPLSLEATDLPVPASSSTLLIHPPLETYAGQWVYTLADPSGKQLQEFLDTNGL